MIALVDCNNFYASCERVFQPHLNGKPLVILSNNDGCVIARSNEAKSLGIPMGAPAFKYKEIFQKNNVQNLQSFHKEALDNSLIQEIFQYFLDYLFLNQCKLYIRLTLF